METKWLVNPQEKFSMSKTLTCEQASYWLLPGVTDLSAWSAPRAAKLCTNLPLEIWYPASRG